MKIIIRMENQTPILFFPDEKSGDGKIACFSPLDGHCGASRAYMRGLKSPVAKPEIVKSWQALARYALHVAQREEN